jgi:hypothetical protein
VFSLAGLEYDPRAEAALEPILATDTNPVILSRAQRVLRAQQEENPVQPRLEDGTPS